MIVRAFLLFLSLTLLATACSSSPEENLITGYFDSLYGEKRSDNLHARMVDFFGDEIKNKRLPVYSAKTRLSEKIKAHSIENWKTTEKDDRLTVSGTITEEARSGETSRKGFIARFAKQFAPDGKEFIWMLFDIVFSSQGVNDSTTWTDLVTLSKTSKTLVEGITNKITIMLIGKFSEDPVMHILRELAACIPKQVTFTWLDPDIDRGMAASYGVTRAPHIVIENKSRSSVLQVSDLYQDVTGSDGKISRILMAERKLVAALLRVGGQAVDLKLISGIGSREMTGAKGSSITKFVTALSNSGYRLHNVSLADALGTTSTNTNRLDTAKSILIFSDPRQGIPGDLDALLMKRLESGKERAFFLMDTPLTPWGAHLAARFGFAHVNATVVDPANKDSFRGARWIESILYDHESVTHFYRRPNFRVLIAEAAGFVPMQVKPTNFESVSIVSSSSNGWGETEFDDEKPDEFEYDAGKDIPGPLHLGFAIRSAGTNARPVTIFIGDCDFVANELSLSRISNWHFASDLLEWLLWPEVHQIRSKPFSAQQFKHLQ